MGAKGTGQKAAGEGGSSQTAGTGLLKLCCAHRLPGNILPLQTNSLHLGFKTNSLKLGFSISNQLPAMLKMLSLEPHPV